VVRGWPGGWSRSPAQPGASRPAVVQGEVARPGRRRVSAGSRGRPSTATRPRRNTRRTSHVRNRRNGPGAARRGGGNRPPSESSAADRGENRFPLLPRPRVGERAPIEYPVHRRHRSTACSSRTVLGRTLPATPARLTRGGRWVSRRRDRWASASPTAVRPRVPCPCPTHRWPGASARPGWAAPWPHAGASTGSWSTRPAWAARSPRRSSAAKARTGLAELSRRACMGRYQRSSRSCSTAPWAWRGGRRPSR